MIIHFADKLNKAIRRKNSRLCVGIDPDLDKLPSHLLCEALSKNSNRLDAAAWAVREFSLSVIKAVASHVPCVKVQVAYYECLGWRGMKVFDEVTRAATKEGLVVIADCKRGDIGATSDAYASGYLEGINVSGSNMEPYEIDAITVNPYMGSDAIEPFLSRAAAHGKGVFVLLRTSNPSGGQIQDLECNQKPVWEYVAEYIRRWANCVDLGENTDCFHG